MPIKVTCKCGKSFAAKEEMAGRKAKCPGCGNVLVIKPASDRPAAKGPSIAVQCACGKALQAPETAAGKQVKCPGCGKPLRVRSPGSSSGSDDLSDLLDEAGYDEERSEHSCPDCGVVLVPEAVICVACGFNLETGKHLKTTSYTKLAEKRLGRNRLK